MLDLQTQVPATPAARPFILRALSVLPSQFRFISCRLSAIITFTRLEEFSVSCEGKTVLFTDWSITNGLTLVNVRRVNLFTLVRKVPIIIFFRFILPGASTMFECDQLRDNYRDKRLGRIEPWTIECQTQTRMNPLPTSFPLWTSDRLKYFKEYRSNPSKTKKKQGTTLIIGIC